MNIIKEEDMNIKLTDQPLEQEMGRLWNPECEDEYLFHNPKPPL